MKHRIFARLALVLFLAVAMMPLLASTQEPRRAQEGRRVRLGLPPTDATLCEKCHADISNLPADGEGFVHDPLTTGNCSACHNAHASSHGQLLVGGSDKMCLPCHMEFRDLGDDAFVHTAVRDGQCVECHEPHHGPLEGGVKHEGLDMCRDCHTKEALQVEDGDLILHAPFEYGECLLCHDPHAGIGPGSVRLAGTQLCAPCHDLDDESLDESHLGAELSQLDCLACHTPHGSTAGHAIRNFQHEPFADRRCDDCHDEDSMDPAALLAEPPMLCQVCHGNPADVRGRRSLHQPVRDGECMACHVSHASDETGLVRGKEEQLCMSCHEDIRKRAEESAASHIGYSTSRCSTCHLPHASAEKKLLRADGLQSCSGCHETHSVFSHPMGAEAPDPRTGQPIDCLSCHDPHGTDHAFFLRNDPNRLLCVECHE